MFELNLIPSESVETTVSSNSLSVDFMRKCFQGNLSYLRKLLG